MALVATVALAACSDEGGDSSTPSPAAGAAGTIHTVPQLEDVANGLLDAYKAVNPGRDLDLSVGSAAQVAQAVSRGSGSVAIMPTGWLRSVGADGESTALGRNLVVIVVPAGNPGQVTGADAFAAGSGLETQVCGPDSPWGNFTALVLLKSNVEPDPARVDAGCARNAVSRVAQGELDAALVFRSVMGATEGVEVIDLPEDQNLIIEVGYAQLSDNESARAFAEFLESDPAKLILTLLGYLP
jgi:molybdate transport system substrate-binding protein